MHETSGSILVSTRRHARWVALAFLIGLAPLTTSCYGKFPLTHMLYAFNGRIGDEFAEPKLGDVVRSGVMWIFIIFPVYGLAMLGDAVIFNLVEFWTGSNLLEHSSVTRDDGTTVALTPAGDGKTAIYTVTKDGKVIEEQTLVRVSDSATEVRGASGDLQGVIVKTASGDLQLQNAEGMVIRTISADTLSPAVSL